MTARVVDPLMPAPATAFGAVRAGSGAASAVRGLGLGEVRDPEREADELAAECRVERAELAWLDLVAEP
ncbi:hypothetical protein [Mycolicibacterium pallens]|uniref:Uncharacterized protein n=1 Tax=Mycolicibacterium pallens TaxID=370524 RepID=A0ABX8V9U1_9MYCO|nr:hypothetical protein [Mycolicibacterium pallens]QYL14546.1 hypothetical protein K0O64_15130 [Mycolicibacterium pallens]